MDFPVPKPGPWQMCYTNPELGPSKMEYPNAAIAPETTEEHSIYPVGTNQRRAPVVPMEPLEVRLEKANSMMPGGGDPRFSLQYWVRRDYWRLLEKKSQMREKQSQMPPNPQPAAPTSANMASLNQATKDQNDKGKRAIDTSYDVDDAGESEDLERDFTMFEDTPKDRSLVPETEELELPSWDPVEAVPASTAGLSSIEDWEPELDPEFRKEVLWNLHHGGDFRFKVPETPSDIESLQHALEITRMDFSIRSPNGRYPAYMVHGQRESYASQHRRLQHEFCRLWREAKLEDSGPAPALYRLPVWMFGFDACYWRPSRWGSDERSLIYMAGLAGMVDEKNAVGLDSMDFGKWWEKLDPYTRMQEAKIERIQLTGSREGEGEGEGVDEMDLGNWWEELEPDALMQEAKTGPFQLTGSRCKTRILGSSPRLNIHS